MRLVREADSDRLRAGLRGLTPAVVTLGILLGGFAVLGRLPVDGPFASIVAGVVLYGGVIGTAVLLATRLDRREFAAYGLEVDAAWLRDFGVGVASSYLALTLSLAWAVTRGLREVDIAAAGVSGGGGTFVGVGLVVLFAAYFLVQNVYEELVYRRILLGNFVEGLTARGLSPAWSAVPATAAATLLFGLFHLPFRGNVIVVVDAALVGVTFSLAYLLTGNLGLAVGVHFGRLPIELLYGAELGSVEVGQVVVLTRDTLAANTEVLFLRLGLTAAFLLAWASVADGDVRIAEAVYRRPSD